MKNIGLNDSQVEESRRKHGSNALSEIKSETFWAKLLSNFGDPMIKILCVALIINVVFVFMEKSEWYEAVGIAVAVILATFVSTFSEYRNENAFQKLQEEASKIKCKVYRNGTIAEIVVDDIVVGDYILLQMGDKIPADGILHDGAIKVDQSVLNGEAKEATKKVMPDGFVDKEESMDFLNEYKVFRGSVVCSGDAVMLVTTVGDKSVYGKIASELQIDDDRESPLKVKLGGLAGKISKFGYIGGILIAVAFLVQEILIKTSFNFVEIGNLYFSTGDGLLNLLGHVVNAVMLAVIIIVMAVPEGLPLMIALVSALNMRKMLKDNVLVRKISGIETAGSLNILFSDKTGTITKGQLEVVTFINGSGKEYPKYAEVPGELSRLISLSTFHNTNAVITGSGKSMKVVGGNGTERAVLGFVSGTEDTIKTKNVLSIPFNSSNKYSATQVTGDYNYTLIKGAPERILERCSSYFDENGKVCPFSAEILEKKITELAGRAIRVLGLAVSTDNLKEDGLPDGKNWTLVGVMGIRDEVRPESVDAIAEVMHAGVQVVMITGDRKDTATAIAKDAKLLTKSSDIIWTSDELAKMSDNQIKKDLPNLRVVARALPSDKSRLVRLAQEMNLVVGMTGDGVNDSPALKKADVGFGMGGGTEVAKEASDIVILDDNFNSIDKAILYGRTIFNSIRKFIVFQLTINVSAVLISFICPLLGMEPPLGITQILWVNLVMDTLAALAFGGEPALARFMKEKPKSRDEDIVSKNMWGTIGLSSVWVTILGLVILISKPVMDFFIANAGSGHEPIDELHTAYFAFFIFAAIFNAFNARTDKINLFDNVGKNKGFLQIMGLIVVVQVLFTYLGGDIFRCYGLNGIEWALVIGMSITVIPIDLIKKAVLMSIGKKA